MQDAFETVRRKCLNCTLHSGEGAGWESILDSVRFCGAQRLGHGVRLVENEDLLKFVVDRRIAVEVGPFPLSIPCCCSRSWPPPSPHHTVASGCMCSPV